MTGNGSTAGVTDQQLNRWATLELAAALQEARAAAAPQQAVELLVERALDRAEPDPAAASAWLMLAAHLCDELEPTAARAALASIDYARARLAVATGDPAAAESHLRAAQEEWQALGDGASVGRTYLGLTQVLAVQGRYDEAEAAAAAAVDSFTPSSDKASTRTGADDLLQVRALRNLATLQLYRERHAAALTSFDLARAVLAQADELPAGQAEEAHIDLNSAGALTFLDRIDAAAERLSAAVEGFGRLGDALNRGRARTNLGRLFLRTGRYMDALTQFEQAAVDILGEDAAIRLEAAADEDLRAADELLLEWGLAYVTLSLLPEAERALAHASALFRASQQPYELGQARYTQGLLFAQSDRIDEATAAYEEARQLFGQLDNFYWLNRTRLALAALALTGSDPARALETLAAVRPADEPTAPPEVLVLDLGTRFGRLLLAAQAQLASGDLALADGSVAALDVLLETARGALAHLQLHVEHLKARLARARHDPELARVHLERAAALLDAQRNALPLEEIRTAFLLDKEEIYADLLQLYLEEELPLDQVFTLIERARSHSLLERLDALTHATPAGDPEDDARRAEVRRRLHWLYNQLLGDSSNRRQIGELGEELHQTEALLHRLEVAPSRVRSSTMSGTRPRSSPARLASFQESLGPDCVAILYSITGSEILALLVTTDYARVIRRLAAVDLVQHLLADLHFQIGRVETRRTSPTRKARLVAGVRAALHRLYEQLVEPFAFELNRQHVLWIPYGPLHQIPFHALWDGAGYLVERIDCSYAPSAALALHARRTDLVPDHMESFAGLALHDPAIPATRDEVIGGAGWFPDARLYLGEEATRDALAAAAAEAHVLHVATHGLFRPDNPYFSAIKLADGWMDVRELYRLQLRARLVVLSACESGAVSRTGGDELIGLARGFMGAGARALVVSQWNVHDSSAAHLMSRFYASLRTRHSKAFNSPPAALAVAQRGMIAAEMHPYYWAAFRAVGG